MNTVGLKKEGRNEGQPDEGMMKKGMKEGLMKPNEGTMKEGMKKGWMN